MTEEQAVKNEAAKMTTQEIKATIRYLDSLARLNGIHDGGPLAARIRSLWRHELDAKERSYLDHLDRIVQCSDSWGV